MIDENSLLYWYEKTQTLSIPQPKTIIVKLSSEEIGNLYDLDFSSELSEKIKKASEEIGFPLFFRTDQASNKHEWKEGSYIEKKKDLIGHICNVIEFNLTASILGLPFIALVFREYIPLYSKFTAFWGDLPIAKERRYFIREGKVQCHHPYWVKDAIERPSVENWEMLLNSINNETPQEIEQLTKYSLSIAELFEGYWSVDFALSTKGEWYLIDMARGEESFHDLDCSFCSQKMRDYYKALYYKKNEE